jgi:hypothetical protein
LNDEGGSPTVSTSGLNFNDEDNSLGFDAVMLWEGDKVEAYFRFGISLRRTLGKSKISWIASN